MSIVVLEHVWILLSDGCRLGARIWLPETAVSEPVPAILEYIPYRKRDGTRGRDEPMHGYYAEHGYAAVRVDMRGSGESDGHLADEYLTLEQDDALEVIEWIAAQPWCSGLVGMQGKSWGGLNALQVAARRPPALKAVITAFSTDNRYTDDIHYMGGCLLNDNLWWGSIMLAYQSRPPDPHIVGASWRERWLERIERLPFFPGLWLSHPHYDEYWKQGSVCEDFAAIECPVLAIGGWADAYSNAVPRLLAGLSVPRLGIIGPWGHVYPHDGLPGPAIGYLQEAVRWWDYWLKGRDTGIMREPMLRAYVEDPLPPSGTRTLSPGRWVGEAVYPSPDIRAERYVLSADRSLTSAPTRRVEFSIRSPQSHGKAAGEWMGTGCPGDAPSDQRLDDGGALIFETVPLECAIEVLGAPRLHLEVASNAPVAHVVARISDVFPDGVATRVSYQVLNLTHRDSHEQPCELETGRYYDVEIVLNACGHRFLPGHRIRLSIGTAYWPMVWPEPYAAMLTVRTGDSVLELPVRKAMHDRPVGFPPPAHGPQTAVDKLDSGSISRYTRQDHLSGEALYVTEAIGGVFGEGAVRFSDTGTEVAHDLRRELRIRDDDPLSAHYLLTQSYVMGRDGWRTRIEIRTEMTGDRSNFYLTCQLAAYEGASPMPAARRHWDETVARGFL